MEKAFSPPAWCASQSSETCLQLVGQAARRRPAGITSKQAPSSPVLRQLRRRLPRLRPSREKLSSGTAAVSPIFWIEKPSSTRSGRSSGPSAVDARPGGVGVGQLAEAPEQLQPLVAPADRRAQRDPGAAAHAEHQEALARGENRKRLSPSSARLAPGLGALRRLARMARTRSKSGSVSPTTGGVAGVASSRQTPTPSSSTAAPAEERRRALGVRVGHHLDTESVGVVDVLERPPADQRRARHRRHGREQPAGRDLHPRQAGARGKAPWNGASSTSSTISATRLLPVEALEQGQRRAASSSSDHRGHPGRVQPARRPKASSTSTRPRMLDRKWLISIRITGAICDQPHEALRDPTASRRRPAASRPRPAVSRASAQGATASTAGADRAASRIQLPWPPAYPATRLIMRDYRPSLGRGQCALLIRVDFAAPSAGDADGSRDRSV